VTSQAFDSPLPTPIYGWSGGITAALLINDHVLHTGAIDKKIKIVHNG
jgi:hypothetical protein